MSPIAQRALAASARSSSVESVGGTGTARLDATATSIAPIPPRSDPGALPTRATVDGVPGALAEPLLLRRLGLGVGDVLRVGEHSYRIAGVIAREPDRGADAFVLGPRLLVDRATLAATGLIQEGSLIRYRYRIGLPDDEAHHAYHAVRGRGWNSAMSTEHPYQPLRHNQIDCIGDKKRLNTQHIESGDRAGRVIGMQG